MVLQNQIKAWVILFGILVLSMWVFRGILLPFVAGLVLAYLLDPLADKLESWHISRVWATTIIMFFSVLIFVGAFFLIVPLVAQQVIGLAQKVPGYFAQLQELANKWTPEIYELLGEERVAEFQASIEDMLANGIGILGNLAGQVMQSGLGLLNALGLVIITPVVAFYMLVDWDRMIKAADALFPRKHQDEIRSVLKDIDKAMSSVIRGQVSVVLLLAVFYATALTLTGLNFGLAIGLIAGLLSFIPFVGFLVGFVLSVGVALVQYWPDWVMISVIFFIFIFGQFLEGNVLYPKLVGGSIGVHPVWLMFSLFAFGLIFGTVGLLLAVPMSAIASVLIRFAVKKYQESTLFLGADGHKDEANPTPE